jgi:uncharacterized protein (DUF433 family)
LFWRDPKANAEPGIQIRMAIMSHLLERITISPGQCSGRPCIRGMRIRVTDVLELFAAGLSAEQVLKELPDLEAEDLHACLSFAARRLDHPVVVP